MWVEFTSVARQMVLEQLDYFEEKQSAELGRRWANAVAATAKRAGKFPNSGAICSFRNQRLSGIRRLPVEGFERYLIFYRVDESDKLLVVSVVHGARNLERLLNQVYKRDL